VWRFDRHGIAVRKYLRRSSAADEQALTEAAEALRDAITNRTGLDVEIVYDRLNRRKLDLIPEPDWSDPPKARIADLVAAVEKRLREGGLVEGLATLGPCARHLAVDYGLPNAGITSDAKHIEIGLTDKGDSVSWVRRYILEPRKIAMEQVLIVGDEFGDIAGLTGSDALMRCALPGAPALSVGVEPCGAPPDVLHVSGGPDTFRALLAEQVRLHQEQRSRNRQRGKQTVREESAPWVTEVLQPVRDEAWRIESGYEATPEHEVESRFAISNGFLGVRASLEQPTAASRPRTYLAGLYDIADETRAIPTLLPAPDWLRFNVTIGDEQLSLEQGQIVSLTRTLDMRRGVALSDWRQRLPSGSQVRLRTLRLASLDRRPLALLLAQLQVDQPIAVRLEENVQAPALVEEPLGQQLLRWEDSQAKRRAAVAVGSTLSTPELLRRSETNRSWAWVALPGEVATLSRVAAFSHELVNELDPAQAAAEIHRRSRRLGVRQLITAHLRRWEHRWRMSDIEIEGDEEAQRAVRFAAYHLNSAANPHTERVSIGARGLTGDAYMGHVFWDTEIFLLPFYIHTWPEAARALLMYRYHNLPAARARALAFGYRGALYPWESADTGDDVTPAYGMLPDGEVVAVQTGDKSHHISAAIAYATWNYWQATGDSRFLIDAGAEMLIETARFWASRACLERDGLYHITDVIGPDEYHEGVSDNAYTNVMARWNIERGLDVVGLMRSRWPQQWSQLSSRLNLRQEELGDWHRVSDGLVTGFLDTSALFEQFRGYFSLQNVDLGLFEPRTVPIDVLFGQDRTAKSQVIKQADVLMFLHLLWESFAPDIRAANFGYYETRCAHGSSLSPAIHAAFAARLGDIDLAERYFRQAVEIDLDDTQGRVAGGIHIGALGALWQAVVFGFAGVSMGATGVRVSPRLPRAWRSIRFPLQWRGRLLRFELRSDPAACAVYVERGRPVRVSIGEQSRVMKRNERWEAALGHTSQEEAAS
jgi:kojibiose phosphorylase